MNGTITTKDGTEIFFKDIGRGQPIVFSHGWPLTSDDWDNQIYFFASQGFGVLHTTGVGMGGRGRLGMGTRWTLIPTTWLN